MTTLLNFLKTLLPVLPTQQALDDSYLAESVDIHDLERRMRNLDDRGRRGLSNVEMGLYPR